MIIEVDKYKENIPGYKPSESELFHIQSAKLADKAFEDALKTRKYKQIIFMAGGTASGKTEFARYYLTKQSQLVYDGTFKNTNGFEIKCKKIKKILENHYTIKIVLIIPENWKEAFSVFF